MSEEKAQYASPTDEYMARRSRQFIQLVDAAVKASPEMQKLLAEARLVDRTFLVMVHQVDCLAVGEAPASATRH